VSKDKITEREQEWEDHILSVLNTLGNIATSDGGARGGRRSNIRLKRQNSGSLDYLPVAKRNLVGILCFVFVRKMHMAHLSSVITSSVRLCYEPISCLFRRYACWTMIVIVIVGFLSSSLNLALPICDVLVPSFCVLLSFAPPPFVLHQVSSGIMGVVGNKGAVGVWMTFYNSTFCFVCAHLAAHRGAVQQRNENYRKIVDEMELYVFVYVFLYRDGSSFHMPAPRL